MKSKITWLIIASVSGLIALSLVQMYLIRNTYELKKEAFLSNTKDLVSTIDDSFTQVDSLRSLWRDHIVDITTAYIRLEIPREEVLKQFKAKTDQLDPIFKNVVSADLEKLGVPTSLKFQKRVRSIVIQDSLTNDTIYSRKNNTQTFILGDSFQGEEYQLGESTSFSECSSSKMVDGRQVIEVIRLNFETETIMNIEGWEKQVLLQMKGLLVLSASIFLFVIGLLFYSIRNLILQKKIADIKTDFINNISHEFKTPLTALSIASNMLKTEVGNDEKASGVISIIERQNLKLKKVLDQVLDKSISYNEIQLDQEQVEVEEFLTSLLDDFELTVKDQEVSLSRHFKVSSTIVLMDRFYISTAITNILENAVKYNHGEIKLNFTAEVDDKLIISIGDNGVGMSEKDQKHLFEKFYRITKDDTHDVKGLGLGLYYASQIVKAHHGSIYVESKTGLGSLFTIVLPLQ